MSKTPRILIVEDEPIVAEDLKDRLTALGYTVVGRTDKGEDVLQLIDERRPDLILMDIHLSGEMSGIDAAVNVRELRHLPVIFITAYADDATLSRAKEAESFGYIIKPFDDQLLRTSIEMGLYKHKMEQALRRSEEELKRAQEIARLGHWTWNEVTKEFTASDELYRIFNLNDKEFKGSLIDEIEKAVPLEERRLVRRSFESMMRTKVESPLEFRVIRPDGTIRYLWAQQGDFKVDEKGRPFFASGIVQDITERKAIEEKLKEALEEIRQLKDRLEAENVYLRKEIRSSGEFGNIVAESKIMRSVLAQAEQVAPLPSTVLLLGETGTGKEMLARFIHARSPRKDKPLVVVNCASLPATLIEAELFGREKGAYTGALTRQIGRFELADGSTIFLDEIGELPLDTQAKLLRVLETGEFQRLGSNTNIKVDVRVIAATNRNLEEEVKKGQFRSDLFYRLNVFPIVIPPLREHKEDIPALIWAFVHELQARMGKTIESIPKKTMDALMNYPWPGNVRELRNATERAMILCNGPVLHFSFPVSESVGDGRLALLSLEDVQRKHIIEVLNRTGWRVRGKNGAAEILKVNPSTLESKMKKLGIKREL